MRATTRIRVFLRSKAGIAAIIVILGFAALLTMRLVSGRGLSPSRVVHLGRAVLDSQSVSSYSRDDFTNVVFLHHSTGRNLIEQGGIRERLTEAGYDFWDQDYTWIGLRRPDGSTTGYSYSIPGDNTDPDGLAGIFGQRAHQLPWNAFSGLLQHEVIAFKSCFPVSNITSNEQLEEYKSYYLAIRDVMDGHLDKVFVVVTPPPLNPVATDAQAAVRARAFADWLKSEEYLSGHPNVFTFDFFGYLAEGDPALPEHNMLRRDYREGVDSHPNQLANETIGPLFVDFIKDAVQRYQDQRSVEHD